MNKNIKKVSIILIILVIGVLLIVPKLISGKKEEGDSRSGQQNQQIPVDVFVVKSVELDNKISTIGTVVANESVEIKSEITKKITGIYFKEGTFVPKGKILFKLDDSDLRARLRKLEIEEDLAVKSEDREKILLEKGLTTQEDYDIRINTLERIRADIDLVNIELSKTNIRAPFSGITGFRNVSIGSLVTNSNVLTTLQDISKLKIDFSIPEKYLNAFKRGQTIRFKVDGMDEEFTGEVDSYDPSLNENTRSITLRAITTNKNGKLLPGTFVKVNLELENINNALMIPTESIVPKLKGQSVFLIKEGIAVPTDVETGIRTEKEIQVLSNLNPGDTVVTTNLLRLRPNSKIKIVNVN
ncbi:MAG TPA: efflux RND transporter periplasmic adaptor subunit [Ignavibacteria bacterium]|nr:efflux RND transporter periplasmic adaptor subunit [Ignavibacteria bacterium]